MPPKTKTHIVYKRVGDLEVPLDLHVPTDVKNAPVLLWFHGGGLLQGRRDKIAPHMLNSVETYKHALISADYRLAPQVGIQEIYEDVRDCVAFIRNPDGLAKQLSDSGEIDAQSVDTSRLAVSGSSAGGYLTFLAGLYVEPKPQVILPIYPITDPLGTFFTTSQPWPTENGGKVIHGKRVDDATVQPFVDRKADAVANNEPSSDRGKMYNYMLDRANLADLLHFNTQKDPQHDPGNDKWRISKQVAARGLPPAYVVHGTVDRDVGIEQADEVVGAMVGEGMEVKYERLAGLDHCFDMAEFDGKDERVKLDKMYHFMHRHV